MNNILNIVTKEVFQAEVIRLVDREDVEWLDAIQSTCDKYGIEYELAGKYITQDLRSLIEGEARKKNLLIKEDTANMNFLELTANT